MLWVGLRKLNWGLACSLEAKEVKKLFPFLATNCAESLTISKSRAVSPSGIVTYGSDECISGWSIVYSVSIGFGFVQDSGKDRTVLGLFLLWRLEDSYVRSTLSEILNLERKQFEWGDGLRLSSKRSQETCSKGWSSHKKHQNQSGIRASKCRSIKHPQMDPVLTLT